MYYVEKKNYNKIVLQTIKKKKVIIRIILLKHNILTQYLRRN